MTVTREQIEAIADVVLKAAGSGFQHYMPSSKERILNDLEDHLAATGRLAGETTIEQAKDLLLKAGYKISMSADMLSDSELSEIMNPKPDKDVREALDIFLNAVDADGWVYPSGKHRVEDGFAIMTPEQHAVIRAALQRPAVPEGYVLVPIEPTDHMKNAGWAAVASFARTDRAEEAAYKAMIAAAPKQGVE